MGLIIFLIMVVAAFNIVGTLTMVVADKTREIGILRAMGLTAPAIAPRSSSLQGAVIGVVGTALGLVLGLAVAVRRRHVGLIQINPAVYFIDHLPVHVELSDIAVIVARQPGDRRAGDALSVARRPRGSPGRGDPARMSAIARGPGAPQGLSRRRRRPDRGADGVD